LEILRDGSKEKMEAPPTPLLTSPAPRERKQPRQRRRPKTPDPDSTTIWLLDQLDKCHHVGGTEQVGKITLVSFNHLLPLLASSHSRILSYIFYLIRGLMSTRRCGAATTNTPGALPFYDNSDATTAAAASTLTTGV
jgi:hypothetical protein